MTKLDKQSGLGALAEKAGLGRLACAATLMATACGADTSTPQVNDVAQRMQFSNGVQAQLDNGKKLEFLVHTEDPNTANRVVQKCDYVGTEYEDVADYENVTNMDLSETDMVAHDMEVDTRYGDAAEDPLNCPDMIPVTGTARRDIRFTDKTPIQLFDLRSNTFNHNLLPGESDVVDGIAEPVVTCVQLPGEDFCPTQGYDETDGGSDSDSEGSGTGDQCTENADCYNNGEGLCDTDSGECFKPSMCYAASAVKGATEAIRTTPSTELAMGTDFKEKDLNEPNSPDGMNFGLYGGCYSRDMETCAANVDPSENGLSCVQLPDGLGSENVVVVNKPMMDPNKPGNPLNWTSQANDSFLQAADAGVFAAMTYDQVFDGDENLKIHGKMKVTNPFLNAIPGELSTFAANYDVEQ